MIDERFQGKGYAPQILDEVMKLVRTYPYGPAEYIWLSYEPENIHGKNPILGLIFVFRSSDKAFGRVVSILSRSRYEAKQQLF